MRLLENERQKGDEICEERSGLLLLKLDSLIEGTELRREAIANIVELNGRRCELQ